MVRRVLFGFLFSRAPDSAEADSGPVSRQWLSPPPERPARVAAPGRAPRKGLGNCWRTGGAIMRFTTARAGSILCLLLGCGLAALPARAAADQAREAVGLFAQSCLKHVEDPADLQAWIAATPQRSEEHTSELQSLMRISYAVFCLKKKKLITQNTH